MSEIVRRAMDAGSPVIAAALTLAVLSFRKGAGQDIACLPEQQVRRKVGRDHERGCLSMRPARALLNFQLEARLGPRSTPPVLMDVQSS